MAVISIISAYLSFFAVLVCAVLLKAAALGLIEIYLEGKIRLLLLFSLSNFSFNLLHLFK